MAPFGYIDEDVKIFPNEQWSGQDGLLSGSNSEPHAMFDIPETVTESFPDGFRMLPFSLKTTLNISNEVPFSTIDHIRGIRQDTRNNSSNKRKRKKLDVTQREKVAKIRELGACLPCRIKKVPVTDDYSICQQ